MSSPRTLIISASSDIGADLARRQILKGAAVVGTYRTLTPKVLELQAMGASLFQLDVSSAEQARALADFLRDRGFAWDTLISAAGVLEPIGKFFSLDFESWQQSFLVNSVAQLRVLHAVFGARSSTASCRIIFFAGGGTNGPFDNYSAYCVGKLVLLKMTELLDSEYPDLQVSIIGTGWVNTKIHNQTLSAGNAAGINLRRTQEFLGSGAAGSSLEAVAECVEWCLSAPRDAVGGRNFSLVHDKWRSPEFVEELIANPDRYKLRRS